MKRRIWKDLCELRLPAIMLIAAELIVAWYISRRLMWHFQVGDPGLTDPLYFFERLDRTLNYGINYWNLWFAPEYVCLLMVAVGLFGSEFSHGAMDRLLAQPIARYRMLAEKIVVYALLMVLLMTAQLGGFMHFYLYSQQVAATSVPSFQLASGEWASPYAHIAANTVRYGAISLTFHLSVGFVALANGLTASLFIRQPHTAFWAALTFPAAAGLVFLFLAMQILGPGINDHWAVVATVVSSIVWTFAALLISWFKFRRLEV